MRRISLNKYSKLNILEFCLKKFCHWKFLPSPPLKMNLSLNKLEGLIIHLLTTTTVNFVLHIKAFSNSII